MLSADTAERADGFVGDRRRQRTLTPRSTQSQAVLPSAPTTSARSGAYGHAVPRFDINGRHVYHTRGQSLQTISVCTPRNIRGEYEDRFWLEPSVQVSMSELQVLPDLVALRDWLAKHGARRERMPELLPASEADADWVVEAVTAVEHVLTRLVNGFLEQPFRHRVEHSFHAEIWSELKRQPVLGGEVPIADGRTLTHLVHKEWPETWPRKGRGGKTRPRGLFDIALLSPQQVRKAKLAQLVYGRIEAPVVIEVGLDYGCQHLSDDLDKLANSRVKAPYALHLSRVTDPILDRTESVLTASDVRCAYARIEPNNGHRRWKHLHEMRVSSQDPAEESRRREGVPDGLQVG